MSARDLVMAAAGVPTGPVTGQVVYTAPGPHTWVCPVGVTSVSVLCVGAGGRTPNGVQGGSGGGGLAYKNNITVTPGNSYTVRVNDASQESSFASMFGALHGQSASSSAGGIGQGYFGSADVGYVGGNGASGVGDAGGGGGGGAGYAGNGGVGGAASSTEIANSGANGSGGGGGGGAGGGSDPSVGQGRKGGSGGGTGLLGQGANGLGGAAVYLSAGKPGTAGSGGSGVTYGGGGGGNRGGQDESVAGIGAVRIIWPGNLRKFPSTRTANE